jgi:adenine-specific DNA-methyltransferase
MPGMTETPTDRAAAAAPEPAASAADAADEGRYAGLSREQLVRLLKRRDAERQLGLVWERSEDGLDVELARNEDFVALSLDAALSHGEAPWQNLIIEGDNFDALRYLRMTHAGRIRCIYIDPPYNTGNRDFVYNDRFVDRSHRFRHSLWLDFMYPRLQLARDLLAEDGVIFVSIDDNELFRLGMLMDRVFGEANKVATCIWQKRYSRENRGAIGDAHEYLLVYALHPESFKETRNRVPLTEDQAKVYKNPNNDPRGRWRSIPLTAQGFRPNQMYAIAGPDGTEHRPPEGRCWSTVESEYQRLLQEGRIYFGKDGRAQPSVIRYLSEVEGLVPWTWWPHEEVGHTDEARKEIQSILGTQTAFDTPKPVRLIERVLQIAMRPGDIALDFFAGSGTAAHAVAKLNAEDGGDRKFILVSSTEATVDQPDKNLCRDVCAERVRRVLGGYTNAKGEAVPGLGGGFAYLRTQRLPRHRLTRRLGHAEIWHALRLMHQLPIDADAPGALAVAEAADQALAYLPQWREPAVEQLLSWAKDQAGKRCAIYSWTPQRLAERLPGHDIQPIPETLQLRFGRGKA